MQSVTIALIIIMIELVLLVLAGLCFLLFRRGNGGRVRSSRAPGITDYRQLAYRLSRIHGLLMAQCAVLTGDLTRDGYDNEAQLAAAAGVWKAIEQLRLAASQLAQGIASAEQICLDLLGAQESLLVAFDACARSGQFKNEGEKGIIRDGQPAA